MRSFLLIIALLAIMNQASAAPYPYMIPSCPQQTGLISISIGNTVPEGCLKSPEEEANMTRVNLQKLAALLGALF
ncbi:hypothetical protein Pst134EA_018947 [Puccinia striiformis f. sp. tritici]|nr:uncharacterized protein Pst134EA_032581 [Puccinia striiformis f. sp. tritici]XP_047802863.1 hypothetical protein Pst134EA_018947 [Puccinia striiformis f. sp. tritici]KAI9615616.1 hypothetical protein H4Q26_011558 [Puccinia striiformis f. sp. tritici PST-130]KNE90267.1 hypothetical protein PSTG_16308 [Puccinia striiformis f. sp. tritici PST-78]POW23041.1 hypothetical protein PSHT_00527 [Puccinia striiformis]KAH9443570.1 hypothetical protein Pst134EA_032581 [Puccinia striiformis f. sp. tritic